VDRVAAQGEPVWVGEEVACLDIHEVLLFLGEVWQERLQHLVYEVKELLLVVFRLEVVHKLHPCLVYKENLVVVTA